MTVVVYEKASNRILGLLKGEVTLQGDRIWSTDASMSGVNWELAGHIAFDADLVREVEVDLQGISHTTYEPAEVTPELLQQGYSLTPTKTIREEIDELKARTVSLELKATK